MSDTDARFLLGTYRSRDAAAAAAARELLKLPTAVDERGKEIEKFFYVVAINAGSFRLVGHFYGEGQRAAVWGGLEFLRALGYNVVAVVHDHGKRGGSRFSQPGDGHPIHNDHNFIRAAAAFGVVLYGAWKDGNLQLGFVKGGNSKTPSLATSGYLVGLRYRTSLAMTFQRLRNLDPARCHSRRRFAHGGSGPGPQRACLGDLPKRAPAPRTTPAPTDTSSRGSDYRETNAPESPLGQLQPVAARRRWRCSGLCGGRCGRGRCWRRGGRSRAAGAAASQGSGGGAGNGEVGTVVVGGEGQIREAGWTAEVSEGKPVSASDDAPQQPPEAPPAEEEDANAQQNTTRGNPLDDDGGTDHESRRFTHHYMPPETRALFAFTELGRALAPKGPPLPGSGGPTDRGWTPFRARTAAAGPPESAAYGREALKNAFADGAIGGALAGRPYHGPTDDGGQVPVAADARTSGDESDADAKASRDAVRQMIWNKFAAPRIRYARRIR